MIDAWGVLAILLLAALILAAFVWDGRTTVRLLDEALRLMQEMHDDDG